jgi:hypothetical protein
MGFGAIAVSFGESVAGSRGTRRRDDMKITGDDGSGVCIQSPQGERLDIAYIHEIAF